MNIIAGLAAAGAGFVLIAVSWVIMRHHQKTPTWAHPWLKRAIILGMWMAGTAIVFTPVGVWVTDLERWLARSFGGVAPGTTGHVIVVIVGLILAADVIVALVWFPDLGQAWIALVLPFILVLSGGQLHALLAVLPVASFAQQVSTWLGG